MVTSPKILMVDDDQGKVSALRALLPDIDCEILQGDAHHPWLNHDAIVMLDAAAYQSRVGHRQEVERLRLLNRQREDLFRQAIIDAPVPIMLHAEDGEVLLLSRVWSKLTGYSEAELSTIQAWLSRAYGSKHLASIQEKVRQLYYKQEWFAEGETEVRAADGRILIWDFHSGPLAPMPDGRRLVISMAVDITVSRVAAQAARNESVKNAMLLNAANDGIHILDMLGDVVQANDAFCRLLGYSPEDIIGTNASRWDVQWTPSELAQRIADLPAQGAIFETMYLHADGHLIDVEINAVRIEIDDQAMLYASARDISERKQIQETLRANAYLLSNAIRISHLGTWEWNIVDNSEIWSDQQFRIFGLEPGSCHPSYELFIKAVHPEDRDAVQSVTDRALAGDGEYDLECRIIWPNGEIHYIRSQGEVYRNDNDQPFLMIGTALDITEKRQSEQLIWEQANFDALTKLANRHMLQDRLQQEIKKSRRDDLSLALLVIDLDRFKEVNDTLGHDMGDVLLVEAAQRITSCVRSSDTVARLGGDEFVIILAGLDEVGCVERIARSLVTSLVQPFRLGDEKAYISASIGIALCPIDALDMESLLKHADQAMYVSKNAGRNRFSYFAPAMQEAAQARRRLTNDLRVALEQHQFKVFYQPIIELATGKIYKAEALIRWQHPTRGLVSPAEFIPLAEETGLIIEIGDWVFREAARQAKRWQTLHHADFQISVNKSPVQFRSDGGHSNAWFSYMDSLQLPGHGIVIEITEGLLMNVERNITNKLLAFRDAGVQVSLDDFGTGYSSLSYLKKFDIDFIKIDQSFVSNMDTDPNNLTLCESIILMAHKLGLKVIAEGVEKDAQRELLAKAGCDFAQGYLFSRPICSDDFEMLLLAAQLQQTGGV